MKEWLTKNQEERDKMKVGDTREVDTMPWYEVYEAHNTVYRRYPVCKDCDSRLIIWRVSMEYLAEQVLLSTRESIATIKKKLSAEEFEEPLRCAICDSQNLKYIEERIQ